MTEPTIDELIEIAVEMASFVKPYGLSDLGNDSEWSRWKRCSERLTVIRLQWKGYEGPEDAADTCWRELVTIKACLQDAIATGQMPDGNLALSRLIIADIAQARRSIEMFHCWMAGIAPPKSELSVEKITHPQILSDAPEL